MGQVKFQKFLNLGEVMKKLFLLLLSVASISLEATHFQNSMKVRSLGNRNEFLVEMQIEKEEEGGFAPEIIASPKILCVQGEPAEVRIESEDKLDLLLIRVLVSENPAQKVSVKARRLF